MVAIVLALLLAGLWFAHRQHVGLGVYGHVLGCLVLGVMTVIRVFRFQASGSSGFRSLGFTIWGCRV